MSQEASSVITEYLLDTQPGLAKVIASKTGSDVTRFVHDPMGIHSQEEPDGSWLQIAKDGLGSVRQVFDDDLAEVYATQYAPYGSIWESSGTDVTPFKFTGEPLDANGLQYHRARYLDPSLGVWMSLDPLETANRYGYVRANPVNAVDPSGLASCSIPAFGQASNPQQQDMPCQPDPVSYCTRVYGSGAPYSGAPSYGEMYTNEVGDCIQRCQNPPFNRNTDCADFVAEVRQIIAQVRRSRASNPFAHWNSSGEAGAVLDRLAEHYSGIPATQQIVGITIPTGVIPWPANNTEERYPTPGGETHENAIHNQSNIGQRDARESYGFRRPYYNNTHHYFAYLKYLFYYGWIPGANPVMSEGHNYNRELESLIAPYEELNDPTNPVPEEQRMQRYAWFYREGVNDLYIVDQAASVARIIRMFGIDSLPDMLGREWCANNEEDVWTLEPYVDEYQYRFPEQFWPELDR